MRILIVEDEALIGMMLEATLAEAGHEVVGPVPTAQRAADLAEQQHPELALVDINLKDGPTGVTLARTLKNQWGIPTLFVSGQTIEARANRDAALGFLSKPFSAEQVVGSVAVADWMLTGRRPPQPALPPTLELFNGQSSRH